MERPGAVSGEKGAQAGKGRETPYPRSSMASVPAIWRPSGDSRRNSRSTEAMPLSTVEWRRLNLSPMS